MIKTFVPIPKIDALSLQLHWIFPYAMFGGLVTSFLTNIRSDFYPGALLGLVLYTLVNVLLGVISFVISFETHGKVIINTFEQDSRDELHKLSDCSFYSGRDKLNVEYYAKFPKVRVDDRIVPEETIFSDWDQEYAEHIAATHSQKRISQ